MKKYLAQLIILVSLLFAAGAAMAAYSFIGPTAAPTGNNTDAPLDISASNQIKHGGLAVNAFQAVSGSDFVQQASFAGLVNGGRSNTSNSTIIVGTPSQATSVTDLGNATVAGEYQSNALQTGGGTQPLCADQNGNFYICGASVTPPATLPPVYLGSVFESVGGTGQIGATISEELNIPVNVSFSVAAAPGATQQTLNQDGVCKNMTTTPKPLGTVTINPGNLLSWDTVNLPANCNPSMLVVTISSWTPTTTQNGNPIEPNGSGGLLAPSPS